MKMPRDNQPVAQGEATYTVVGWREWIALPELGVRRLKAKIDTGARTSALHATRMQIRREASAVFVDFVIPTIGQGEHRCTAPLIDQRSIKNTGGVEEIRLVVRTMLSINGRRWPIDLSLTNRESMRFDLILGRTAIRRHRLLVDPSKSFLAGEPGVRGD